MVAKVFPIMFLLSFNVGFNFATNYNFFLLIFSFFLVFEGDGKCSGIMM